MMKQIFLNIYGRHTAINYHQKYRFKEQWENIDGQDNNDSGKGSTLYLIYALVIMLGTIYSMWNLTMNFVFPDCN